MSEADSTAGPLTPDPSPVDHRYAAVPGEGRKKSPFSYPLSPAPLSPAPLSPAPLSPAPLSPAPLSRGRRPRGFTLVEMLVVVAIIGILASMLLGTLYLAMERARKTRTRTLVDKLHNQIMLRWEEFETRRVPLAISSTATPDQVALAQLIFLDEIMRMELPDSYIDLNPQYYNPFDAGWQSTFEALSFDYVAPLPGGCQRPDPNEMTPQPETEYLPSVTRAYLERVSAAVPKLIATNASITTPVQAIAEMARENQSAEMLYLIVTTSFGDEDSSGVHFADRDVGDTDEDGMPEFVDAWGNPIEWIRWPAGYANVNTVTGTAPAWGLVSDLIIGDAAADPDPFDPRRVRQATGFAPTADPIPPSPAPPPPLYSFRLMPLIMSPGPDGEYGVVFRRKLPPAATATEETSLRQQYSDPYYFWQDSVTMDLHRRGMPVPIDTLTGQFSATGEWVHHDNITNHLREAE